MPHLTVKQALPSNSNEEYVLIHVTVSDYYDGPGEDPYIHLHKEELARSALLFGVGVLKGVAVTALVNSANGGVTIGK